MRSHPLDFRSFDRKRTRVPAWISYGASPTPIPCVLWDVSDGGARITAAHSNILPDMFELILTRNGTARRYCQVVWRRKPHIGIKFIEPSEARGMPFGLPAGSNRSGYGILARS